MEAEDCDVDGSIPAPAPLTSRAATTLPNSPPDTDAGEARYTLPTPEAHVDEDGVEVIIFNYPPGANTVTYTGFSTIYDSAVAVAEEIAGYRSAQSLVSDG